MIPLVQLDAPTAVQLIVTLVAALAAVIQSVLFLR